MVRHSSASFRVSFAALTRCGAGDADLVALAREFLRDPHFPRRAAKDLGYHITLAAQYERSREGLRSGGLRQTGVEPPKK